MRWWGDDSKPPRREGPLTELAGSTLRIRPASVGKALLWGSASGLFLLLLSSLFRIEAVPASLAAALCAFAMVAAWRPGAALALLAIVLPLASWTGRHWHGGITWAETTAAACLAGYAARQAFDSRRDTPDLLTHGIYCTVAVVVSSLAVQLLVLQRTIGGAALGAHLWQLLTVDYFIRGSGIAGVDAAMRLIEGLLLMHAGVTLGRSVPSFGPRMIRAIVVGAVAASALNLWRVWMGALRLDSPVIAFLGYLGTLRFNTHYGDVNAAGSYFVQALLPALSLARDSSPTRWIPAALVILASVVLSGSRAAMVAGLAAGAIAWRIERRDGTLRGGRKGWSRRSTRGVALLAILTAGTAMYLLAVRNMTPSTTALSLRWEFWHTGLRMFAAEPLFGVGIGQYYASSTLYSSPELRAVFPHENAHNNFLQILAELGVVGFVVFVSLLIVSTVRMTPVVKQSFNSPPPLIVAGPLAFVLTWVTGHPLLTDEPALTFWLLLGSLVGWGGGAPERPPALTWTAFRRSNPLQRLLAPALAGALAVTVPLRARWEISTIELEHQGIGLSEWHIGSDGVRYRVGAARSTVFIPSEPPIVTVPLRSIAPDAELEVEIYLDGRIADIVRVPSDTWRILAIRVPKRTGQPRFLGLELRVRDGSRPEAPSLMIGKVQPR